MSQHDAQQKVDCPQCNGDGRLVTFHGSTPDLVPCHLCNGYKKVPQCVAEQFTLHAELEKKKRAAYLEEMNKMPLSHTLRHYRRRFM